VQEEEEEEEKSKVQNKNIKRNAKVKSAQNL
jgi:hypothetical protein